MLCREYGKRCVQNSVNNTLNRVYICPRSLKQSVAGVTVFKLNTFKIVKHRKGCSFVAAERFFGAGILYVCQGKKRFDVTKIQPLRRIGFEYCHSKQRWRCDSVQGRNIIFQARLKTMYEDKTLICKECGNEFTFTAGEQEFYAEKGFVNEPQRCKACRDARKNAARGEREWFEATCNSCGGVAKVPFKPREDRPVYCSECFAKKQEEA